MQKELSKVESNHLKLDEKRTVGLTESNRDGEKKWLSSYEKIMETLQMAQGGIDPCWAPNVVLDC